MYEENVYNRIYYTLKLPYIFYLFFLLIALNLETKLIENSNTNETANI